uniref:Reverse transcriptase domain-containing protein n=1 Tax=Tanacetum cinerariifolium TaxID=118510 RepID=A0A6L2L4M8_TANCI|nr:reverse transcriptase domain-containing protein [Tanacetum cinerariifolium]
MITHSGPFPTALTSTVQNTVGKGNEISQENSDGPASDAALKEYYDKHYNQLLLILAEKIHQEKVQLEKLNAVKACPNFEKVSQCSEKKDGVQKDGEMCVPQARRQGEGKLDRSKTSIKEAFGTNKDRSKSKTGHTTHECMHLKRKIEEMVKIGKLSHLIKELKQKNRKDQEKTSKKGETSGKDKSLAILMVRKMGRRVLWLSKLRSGDISSIVYTWMEAPPHKSCMKTASIDSTHRKAESKKNPGSSINGLWNAQIPNDRRNGHIAKQHDHSTQVHDSLKLGAQQPVINQVIEEKIQVTIHLEYPKQTIAICSTLTEEGRKELCSLLRGNFDIFVGKPTNRTGVSQAQVKYPQRMSTRSTKENGSRTSKKGKILADFIVERPEDDSPDKPMEDEEELLDPWILFTNGSSCTDGSRAKLILTNPDGMEFTYALRFEATNNEA